jgi:hypothetical protein
MDFNSSFFYSTTRAGAFPHVFSKLRTQKWSPPLCGVAALILCGALVGVHAQTAHFAGAHSVVANAGNNGLSEPYGVAADGSGNVHSADSPKNRDFKETPSGGNFGKVNVGSTSTAPISMIFTFDTAGRLGSTAVVTHGVTGLDFANAGTGTCKAGTAYTAGETCTVDVNFTPKIAGTRYGAAELLDDSQNVLATGYLQATGVGPRLHFLPGVVNLVASQFSYSGSQGINLAVDGSGNVFITDVQASGVFEEALAAGAYTETNILQSLENIQSIAIDGSGSLYLGGGCGAYKEAPSAGGYSQSQFGDVCDEFGIAVDGSGDVYIAGGPNGMFVERPSGGEYSQSSFGAGFVYPYSVAVDGSGNVYVADYDYNLNTVFLYKETPANGSYMQTKIASGLLTYSGIAVDGVGNLYVALPVSGSSSPGIFKLSPSSTGYTQTQIGTGQIWQNPISIATDSTGNVYVADGPVPSGPGVWEASIYRIDLTDPPILQFAATAVGKTSSDSPQTVTLENVGNSALSFAVPSGGNNPSISTNFILDSSVASACPLVSSGSSSPGTLAVDASCLLPISFSPTILGSLTGSLVLTDNALNVSGSTQTIPLSGTGTVGPAILTSPTPGSTLTGNSETFMWSDGGGVSAYDLHLSAVAPGGYDLFSSGHITSTSVAVGRLPANGKTIYARLYSIIDGATVYNDYTYTAKSDPLATLTSPAPGSTLTSSSVKFTWSVGTSGTQYDLHLSAVEFGAYDLYVSGHKTSTSVTVNGLPTDGETIYARLYSILNGATAYNDYTLTAATLARLISPAPGSTLAATSVTFTWSPVSPVSQYDLHLSAVAFGGYDLFVSGPIAGTSRTVYSLPTNGETIYARLYTILNGVTLYNDYIYKAQ